MLRKYFLLFYFLSATCYASIVVQTPDWEEVFDSDALYVVHVTEARTKSFIFNGEKVSCGYDYGLETKKMGGDIVSNAWLRLDVPVMSVGHRYLISISSAVQRSLDSTTISFNDPSFFKAAETCRDSGIDYYLDYLLGVFPIIQLDIKGELFEVIELPYPIDVTYQVIEKKSEVVIKYPDNDESYIEFQYFMPMPITNVKQSKGSE